MAGDDVIDAYTELEWQAKREEARMSAEMEYRRQRATLDAIMALSETAFQGAKVSKGGLVMIAPGVAVRVDEVIACVAGEFSGCIGGPKAGLVITFAGREEPLEVLCVDPESAVKSLMESQRGLGPCRAL